MSDFQKNTKKPPSNQPLRQFPTIGDLDEQQSFNSANYDEPNFGNFEISPEEEEEIRKARKEKVNPPIALKSKTRLEYLADIGKITKDVNIGGTVFTLKTLKSKEQRQVYLTLVDVTNKVDELYNLKLHTLAHSLVKIDHQDVDIMVKIDSFIDRIKMIEDFEEAVTDQLYSAYEALKSDSSKQFDIKTESDMKEVSEDLKK